MFEIDIKGFEKTVRKDERSKVVAEVREKIGECYLLHNSFIDLDELMPKIDLMEAKKG